MQCKHIKTNGHRCGSPAVRNKNFCYYHYDTRLRSCYLVPALEDADAIQVALTDLARGIADNSMDLERARVLAFVLKTAANNLRFTTFQRLPSETAVSTELPPLHLSEEERVEAEKFSASKISGPEDLPDDLAAHAIENGYFDHLSADDEPQVPITSKRPNGTDESGREARTCAA
jgi:hypothetical protein